MSMEKTLSILGTGIYLPPAHPVREMAAVGWRLRRLNSDTLQSTTLPGHFKGAYWEPDSDAIHALVEPLGQ